MKKLRSPGWTRTINRAVNGSMQVKLISFQVGSLAGGWGEVDAGK
jgi:hypothetical protein